MTRRFVLTTRPALIAALAVAGLWLAGCGSGSGSAAAPGTHATDSSSTSGATTGTGGPDAATSTAIDTTHTAPSSLALWPFTTAAEVRQWQAAYRAAGSQPWHLDAGQTALAFTRGHLGYTDVDRVTSRRVVGGDAHIGVGWPVPGQSGTRTVAVLHLIRFGSGADAPWAVVGSDDTVLTVDTPRYGSTVASPVRVGGRITGVDENLRVIVLGPASSAPLFVSPGLPAGGERTPWSTTVRFRARHGTVLTIAVSTGGHLKKVELFAVNAVRAA
jgi:hypothetical protein